MTALRVLVLGGSGRIGSMLRRCWAHDAEDGHTPDIEFTFQTRQADVAQAGDLLWDILVEPPDRLVAAGPFDCMIVLSGVVPRVGADLGLNTALGVACVAAAARLGVSRVLLASTSAVYGTYSDAPFTQTDPTMPVNDYGRAKLEMEGVCRARARAAGIALCCLRIGNVAGADALLLNGAALSPPDAVQLDVFADGGTPVRSYIGPHTLGRVLGSLVRAGTRLPDVLNIAAPHPVSMRALAEAAQMPFVLTPAGGQAHQHVTLDCGALAGLHDFDPACAQPTEMIRQWRACRI